jgi:hypothetical protein
MSNQKNRIDTAKRMIFTAPTGVAATNAGGVTLHTFFQRFIHYSSFAPPVPFKFLIFLTDTYLNIPSLQPGKSL